MITNNMRQHIENLFKNSQNFSDSDKNLDIPKILESIEKIDIELIKILKDDEKAKKEFFTQIDDIFVLNQNKLIEFFTLNDYMKNGSFTAYSNKIGLIRKDNFIKKFDDVVLAFPHKDCVLEGGQTKDDDKKKEVFYNEILSNNRLGVVSRVQKKGSDKGTFFKPVLDYILCYAKDKQYLSGFKVGVDESKFKKIETEGKRKGEKYEDSKSLYQSSLDPMRGYINQRYYIECPDGSLVIPKGNIFPNIKKDGNNITPKTQFDGVWRWGVDSYLKQKDLLVFKETPNSPLIDENAKQSKWNVYTKRYLKDAQEKGNIPSNLFDNFTNFTATSTLNSMNIDFTFSKPKELIEHINNSTFAHRFH